MRAPSWWRRLRRDRIDAKVALELSKRHLADTYAQWDRVHAVAEEAERQMRENHLAPTIAKALRDRR